MSGFPNVPTRAAFGPTYLNKREVQNPNRELGADAVNLLMWQLAGASRVASLVTILYDGAADDVLSQALAFDPRALLDDIPIVKNGTGDYTATFAATYKDQRDTDVVFVPKAAFAMVQNAPTAPAGIVQGQTVISGQTVQILSRDSANTPVDSTVYLLVW